ncbi:MAG: glutamate racemase [Proteobacteria bacterium]|nr:glutamate racemase [Pseudomonadota bacterium]HQR03008.1 glutamate racemase [Rhodocyclaceae bacterium]
MIGVFDSGLGGLSVLAAIAHALPRADLCYIADTAHVPYGEKSEAFIQGRVLAIGDHLVSLGCGLIVVACNTATVAAIAALRQRHPQVPVVGVEPGVKPAAAATRSGHIAVLATEATARSQRLAHLIRDHAGHLIVRIEPCPGWASRVEMLELDDPGFAAQAGSKIEPLLATGVDQIVLGCTHYSFLRPILAPLVKGRAGLVDVADAVARQTIRLAGNNAYGKARLMLQATRHPEHLQAALPRLGLRWLGDRTDHPAGICPV